MPIVKNGQIYKSFTIPTRPDHSITETDRGSASDTRISKAPSISSQITEQLHEDGNRVSHISSTDATKRSLLSKRIVASNSTGGGTGSKRCKFIDDEAEHSGDEENWELGFCEHGIREDKDCEQCESFIDDEDVYDPYLHRPFDATRDIPDHIDTTALSGAYSSSITRDRDSTHSTHYRDGGQIEEKEQSSSRSTPRPSRANPLSLFRDAVSKDLRAGDKAMPETVSQLAINSLALINTAPTMTYRKEDGSLVTLDKELMDFVITSDAPHFKLRKKCYGMTVFTKKAILEVHAFQHLMTNPYSYLLVAEEKAPSTQGRHLHVYIEHEKQPNWRQCPWADFFGNPVFYSHIYNKQGWITYCKKGHSFQQWGEIKDPEVKIDGLLIEADKLAKTKVEFFDIIWAKRPGYLATSISQLEKVWQYRVLKKQSDAKPKYQLSTFKIPPEVTEWKAWMQAPSRTKCLVLVGPTKMGKTELVLTLFPENIYMRTELSLQVMTDRTGLEKFLILDDVSWEVLRKEAKAWLTQMGSHILTDKYLPKVQVDFNIPSIYLMNEKNYELLKADPEFETYWLKNMHIVMIENKLF
uniref:Replication protein n=1 Tax=Cruciviridae sp. TaxID=1955495 RepID=A0A1S6LVN0_9VIRU|nr:replication protein [Cruciviridae sp.]